MNDSTPRFLFAGLGALCLVAIWCGALFEIGRQKRGATISARHFRWRMASALLWTLIVGSLVYALLFSWPWPLKDADPRTAKRFIALTLGAILLLLPAFALLFFDLYLTAQTRRLQTARLDQDLSEVARRAIEEAQIEAGNRARNPGFSPNENSGGANQRSADQRSADERSADQNITPNRSDP